MENKYDISVKTLDMILKKLNENKNTRHYEKKLFRISEIISVKTRTCKYVGSSNISQDKKHLQVKFTSPDESGVICVSVLTDKYYDLIYQ
jgi:thymidylate synthase